MKALSRDFSNKEKILLVLLSLILVGLVYYWFVDVRVRDSIASFEADAQASQTELDTLQLRLMYLQGVQNDVDALKDQKNLSWMGSYSNSKEEVAFLNDILANTIQYSISFANVTKSGDQVRRSFTLQYQTKSYFSAQKIMNRLLTGKLRCLVGDVRCNIADNKYVTVSCSATFYETMVGGEPDAALPADTAAVNK